MFKISKNSIIFSYYKILNVLRFLLCFISIFIKSILFFKPSILFFFSEDGKELLASYCSDNVYLFSTRDNSQKTHFSDKTFNEECSENPTKNHTVPPFKRLRLRNDWSDTGPQARPQQDIEGSAENHLMNRMTELLTRWVNESLSEANREVRTELWGNFFEMNQSRENSRENDNDESNTSSSLAAYQNKCDENNKDCFCESFHVMPDDSEYFCFNFDL